MLGISIFDGIYPKAVRCVMALLTVDPRFRDVISDYRNNCSEDTSKKNMRRGGEEGDAGDLDFDDILQVSTTIKQSSVHSFEYKYCISSPKLNVNHYYL